MKDCLAENIVVLKKQPENKWLVFKDPAEIIECFAYEEVVDCLHRIDHLVNSCGFHAAGFVAYEAGPAFDPAYRVKYDDNFPMLWFGLYSSYTQLDDIIPYSEDLPGIQWAKELDFNEYSRHLVKIKQLIKRGDTYQVNYTFRLRAGFDLEPWSFFKSLAKVHNPPFAAFVNIKSYAVCSFSPEMFFQLDGTDLVSRPMKGTLSRGLTWHQDQMQASKLGSCPKNRAENVMITDMVRNDLGRIADPGSVEVAKLFQVEKYASVWQMTSEIKCRTSARMPTVFQSLFPPSSITGAPKHSTMNIIADLEKSPRRVYTGSIGYLGPGRQSQFNVAIRTVLVDKVLKQAEFGVGGGIVWDSTIWDEWTECKTKAKSLHSQRSDFSLLETFLWTPEGGYHLLGAHLYRLEMSTRYFDFNLDMQRIKQKLDIFARSLAGNCWKIRLLADNAGWIGIKKHELDKLKQPFYLSLSRTPVNSDNVFLYHKTTNREVYKQAVPVNPQASGVLLWNEREELTETDFANVVFEIKGRLCTPPVKCGLLPGTYRQYLLASGAVQERVVRVADLEECPAVYLANSVRGLVRAKLA